MEQEIRWKQRFANYEKALKQLEKAVNEYGKEAPDIVKEGIIQRFEFTHELAWKVMKDYLEYEGYQNINGSRSASRTAFKIGLIGGGQTWMDMIESRNRTVHVYDEKILNTEFLKIEDHYFPLFKQLYEQMKTHL
jgi:nucleotidyltransferase substrate binding protein (TIGR01987 family)